MRLVRCCLGEEEVLTFKVVVKTGSPPRSRTRSEYTHRISKVHVFGHLVDSNDTHRMRGAAADTRSYQIRSGVLNFM